MKKGLIALAIASAFVAPAAMADTSNVKIYGVVDMTVGSSNNGFNTSTQVASNTTKLGFKGSEDLGDGLNAIWQIEQQIDLANSGAKGGAAKTGFASRNSFLGLKGESWGTVLLGTHDTPYKIATRHMDPFGDEIGDNRAIMGKGHDSRLKNVLAYISPSMNGFKVAGAYVAGADLAPTTAASIPTKGDAVSLAALYDVDALKVHFGYQNVKFGTAATGQLAGTAGDKTSAWKLGVGYTFDALTVNAIYESIKSSGVSAAYAANAKRVKNFTVNGVYKFGSDAVKLAYVKAGNVGGVAATGAKQFSLGYDHSMSKRTKIYAVYSKVSNDTGASYGLADTSTGNPTGGAAFVGKNPSAFGIGIKHAF